MYLCLHKHPQLLYINFDNQWVLSCRHGIKEIFAVSSKLIFTDHCNRSFSSSIWVCCSCSRAGMTASRSCIMVHSRLDGRLVGMQCLLESTVFRIYSFEMLSRRVRLSADIFHFSLKVDIRGKDENLNFLWKSAWQFLVGDYCDTIAATQNEIKNARYSSTIVL